jgi:hypothetical protein
MVSGRISDSFFDRLKTRIQQKRTNTVAAITVSDGLETKLATYWELVEKGIE